MKMKSFIYAIYLMVGMSFPCSSLPCLKYDLYDINEMI